jgi:hypothetical protein
MDSIVHFILLMDGFRPGQVDRFSSRDLIELCQIEPGQIFLDRLWERGDTHLPG